MATPICALFNAGASFTPSPVTATILPCAFRFFTILNLFSGDTLENIIEDWFVISSVSSLSDKSFNSWDVKTTKSSSLVAKLISLPIASAVIAWSPVIM